MELLRYTASPPWGSGQRNSCLTLPHRPGAVGSATPAIHCLTAQGQRAVELLFNTASPPGGSGQWSSCSCCNALLICLGAVGSGPHFRGAVGSGNPAIHCLTACGNGQCKSCNALPHRPGAVGSGTPAAVPYHLGAVGSVVVWCGVVWCSAVRCGAMRCGAVRCGAVRCGVVRRGVVWCGVAWCGVV